MSEDGGKTTLNTDGLDKLMKALKNLPVLRVGILGDAPRTKEGAANGEALNNATIGLFHEVGTGKSPMRSFLRMPLMTQLDKRLKAAGMLEKSYLREVLKTASFVPVMLKVGVLCEAIVSDAFDSGGFGEWKPSNMSGKTNHQTLVETQQLRNSITSEVKKTA